MITKCGNIITKWGSSKVTKRGKKKVTQVLQKGAKKLKGITADTAS